MQRDDVREDSPKLWLEYARADLAIAQIPLPPNCLYEHLCFHAQQAAEKSLKAVLLSRNIDFPPTHNLQVLIDRLPHEITKLPFLADAVDLTPYAVATRYPGESEPISEEEYREALQIANAMVAWAESLIASLS